MAINNTSKMNKDKKYRVLFRDSIPDESGFFNNVIWRTRSTDSVKKYLLLLIQAFFINNFILLLSTLGLFILFETCVAFYWIIKNHKNEFLTFHNSFWYLIISFLILILFPLLVYYFDRKERPY